MCIRLNSTALGGHGARRVTGRRRRRRRGGRHAAKGVEKWSNQFSKRA